MAKKRKLPSGGPRAQSRRTVVHMYHGTAGIYGDTIRKEGIKPFRQSGAVYLTSAKEKALAYAKAWAVGLHVVGEAPAPHGVVLTIAVDGQTKCRKEQRCDYRLPTPILPGQIVDVEPHDFSDLGEVERAGHLANFVGILGWGADPYVGDVRWQAIYEKALSALKALPEEIVQEGMRLTPAV
ncbi:hypothetical protein ACFL09_00295 [Planctomycetota bacterium]